MPAFRIAIDNVVQATINTADWEIIAVHLSGSHRSKALATLYAGGGRYSGNAPATHVIWLPEYDLAAGQRLDIWLDAEGETRPAGKTIAELYPDAEPVPADHDFSITDEVLAEIASRPTFHASYAFDFTSSNGTSLAVRTPPEDDGFMLGVLWDAGRPEQCRVSLHSSNLTHLQARQAGNSYVQEVLAVGGHVSLTLAA